MTDVVVDSNVIAKWMLPEADSAQAQRLITEVVGQGRHLIALDLAYPEVASAIWKQQRQKSISSAEANGFLDALIRAPVEVVPAVRLLKAAMPIAIGYDRSIYDALFVALAQELGVAGVTADEPLYHAVSADFPRIVLLRNWQ
jgi:predicted nucleic acid-binding protein